MKIINFSLKRFNVWRQRVTDSELLGFFIELNYLAIIFLVPIWFAAFFSSFNLFEFNKIVVFKILLWLLLFLTTMRILFFPAGFLLPGNFKIIVSAFKKYWLLPALLVAGLLFISLFSLDFSQSFFGSYERQEGVSSYFFYFLWSLLLFINLIAWKNVGGKLSSLSYKIKRILVTANISASVVAVYAILQILNIDFLNWPEPPFITGRALSTLGQPNFLASFLLLTIPLAVYLTYSSRHFLLKSFFAFTVAFQVIGLFASASRGGLVALFLMGALFVIYLFFAFRFNKKLKIAIVVGVAAILFFGIAIFNVITPGRLQESFDLSVGSFAARINFFQASADAILQKPLLGYGLENSGEVFIKYYDNDWGIYADVSSNTDRAHNLVLDILLNVGFLGLILFSLWYYSFFKLAFLNQQIKKQKKLILAITLGAFAYLISLMFSFAIVAAEVYFWLFFTILIVVNFNQNSEEDVQVVASTKRSSYRLLKFIFLGGIFIISAWQISLNAEAIVADSYFNDIYVALGRGEPITATILNDAIEELKINPVQAELYNHFLGDNISNQLDQAPDLATTFIIKQQLQDVLEALPDYGYKNFLLKAKLHSQLGNYEQANIYFAKVLELAPNWPLTYLEMGRDFVRRGQLIEAENAYKALDTKLPDVGSNKINDRHRKATEAYRYFAYSNLAAAYFAENNYARAERFFTAAYRNMVSDYSLLKRIADTHYLQGNLDVAIHYVEHGAVLSPYDYNWRVALASLYFEKGDKEAAAFNMREAIRLAPDKIELKELEEKYKN